MRGGPQLNGPAGARTAGRKGLLWGTAGHKGLPGGRDAS